MFNPFSRADGVDALTLKRLLDVIITPVANRLGFEKKGDYLWHSPGDAELRYGLKYSLLKGNKGTLTWGLCASYIPIISGKSLKFCRTEKSFDFHLFEWTDEYSDSFFGGSIQKGVAIHGSIEETQGAIAKLIQRYEQAIADWIGRASAEGDLVRLAETQLHIGRQYKLHYPVPEYILPYLYAHNKMGGKALASFDTLQMDLFKNDDALRLKARMHLLKLIQ